MDKTIIQAEELLNRVRMASKAMNRFDGWIDIIEENEVSFRYKAICRMLLMSINDIEAMVRDWKNEK